VRASAATATSPAVPTPPALTLTSAANPLADSRRSIATQTERAAVWTVNLMTSLILDVYEYRMRRTKSDRMFDIRYEMPDGSTQIWTVVKNVDWRVQVAEVDSRHQEMLDRQLEQSIQALEVRVVR